MPTIVTRGTKKTWIVRLLAMPEVFADERHRLSLESALERLNEGLKMTPTSKVILAIYKPILIDMRNKNIGKARSGKGKGNYERSPQAKENLRKAAIRREAAKKAKALKSARA